MSIKFADDMTAKQFTAVNYRYKKLLEEILITKSLTIVDFILDCFYAAFMISGPLFLLFVIIVNQYFKEKIEKEIPYRFCKKY